MKKKVNKGLRIYLYNNTERCNKIRQQKMILQADSTVWSGVSITKTRLFKYIEKFTTKNWKFSDKNSDIFIFLLKT